MINLANRTEYSFNLAYGPLKKVLSVNDKTMAGICDRHGTWGHVAFEKACKKAGVKPIFGVELAVVEDALKMEKQGVKFVRIIALNNDGLRELYELTTKATEQFYYFPRIGRTDLNAITPGNAIILTANEIDLPSYDHVRIDLTPATRNQAIEWAKSRGIDPVATSDNFFPTLEDRPVYEVAIGQNRDSRTTPMHILNEWEFRLHCKADADYKELAMNNAKAIGEMANVQLPRAKLVQPHREKTLFEMCQIGAVELGINLDDPVYQARLKRELDLIEEKEFEDYFYLIADLIQNAKKTMLVGPARGSSCGSLVCYLIGITDVDPIPYDLLFERFIDINRKDLPDIDIDFPDIRRDEVIVYLREKYGPGCVAQLGTVNKYKAKNTINAVAKELKVPVWELSEFKDAVIERADGDARAEMCIADTFEMEVGKRLLQKRPEMFIAAQLEGHSNHSGKHAAGIVVTSDPVSFYCSVDAKTGAAMVDKYDAEDLNLLKIDALGLRTLSVLQDCLDQIGWTRKDLLNFPRDYKPAFDTLNMKKFSGIFQFEGQALQALCRQMTIDNFEDIVALTALARPGPLMSGMAYQWLARRTGRDKVVYEHPQLEKILGKTYGVMVYQEDIMKIVREVALMSWEDVSSIRKAISKSAGQEIFEKYRLDYLKGCAESAFEETKAVAYWNAMISFGSYAFNRSHAVAYGLVSYWCMALKSKFPLEYAAACLRNAKDDEQSLAILRELAAEGYKYKSFDKELSVENWSVQDGKLLGGLLGVKGIAGKTAKDIMTRRAEGRALTKRQTEVLENATTPYDMVFEAQERFGHIFAEPLAYNITTPLTTLDQITDQSDGTFCFIAKIAERTLKNANDHDKVEKRGHVIQGQALYLNLKVRDDTGELGITINRDEFLEYGKPLLEEYKVGDWFCFKGRCTKGFRWCHVKRWKPMDRMKRIGEDDVRSEE